MATHAPAANTPAVITLSAPTDPARRWVIDSIHWSYSGVPAGGSVVVTSNGITLYTEYVSKDGPGFLPFFRGLKGTIGKDVTITLAPGGGTVAGSVNVPDTWLE